MAHLDPKNGLILSTGRIIPNGGAFCILGIKHDASEIFWGYDSGFSVGYTESGEENATLTWNERREIAEMMIQLWKAWAFGFSIKRKTMDKETD